MFDISFTNDTILLDGELLNAGDTVEGELRFDKYDTDRTEILSGDNIPSVNSTIVWKVTLLQLDQIHSINKGPCMWYHVNSITY
jgi:hypothetical protein